MNEINAESSLSDARNTAKELMTDLFSLLRAGPDRDGGPILFPGGILEIDVALKIGPAAAPVLDFQVKVEGVKKSAADSAGENLELISNSV